MFKNEDEAPETTTVVPDDSTTSSGQPETSDSVNWEKRFKGMQGAYGKLKGQYDEAELTLAEKQAELDTLAVERNSSKAKLEELAQQLEADKAEAARLKEELEKSRKDNEISKVVLKEYPELSQFWADGVIARADDPEKQVEIFDKFKSAMNIKVDSVIDDKVKGSSPVAVGTSTKLSANEIFNEMSVIAGSTKPEDVKRYKQLQVLWDKENE